MLGGLNKIVDRNFLVGYLLPATALLGGGIGIVDLFDVRPEWARLSQDDLIKDSTILAAIALLTAFVLMALNSVILRAFEGYFFFGLYQHLNFFYVWFWRYHDKKIKEIRKTQAKSKDNTVPIDERPVFASKDRLELMHHLESMSKNFPSEEHRVLPTRFGNAIAAFEDYSMVLYGFEMITGWSRLNAVVPKDYREIMDGARADMDMWMNLWLATYLLMLQYACLAIFLGCAPAAGSILIGLPGMSVLMGWMSHKAAVQWGEWIKGAFDVYLPKLRDELGLTDHDDSREEREMWKLYSQVMVYRNEKALDKLLECYSTAASGHPDDYAAP